MRISDWSSDVCSSDLARAEQPAVVAAGDGVQAGRLAAVGMHAGVHQRTFNVARPISTSTTEMIQKRTITRGSGQPLRDRKSVVEGKSVSVRVDLGGRRNLKKKKSQPLQL